jgi:hypothetical protein
MSAGLYADSKIIASLRFNQLLSEHTISFNGSVAVNVEFGRNAAMSSKVYYLSFSVKDLRRTTKNLVRVRLLTDRESKSKRLDYEGRI